MKNDLHILFNQCNYPGIYDECICLGCNVKDNKDDDNVNVNDNFNVNDNVNANVNVNVNDNVDVNENFNFNDNVNDNDNVSDNDNDNNDIVYRGSSCIQRSSPNLRSSYVQQSRFSDQGDISIPRNN